MTVYSQRPYAKAIVKHLNSRDSRSSIVEIGCGLGDILRRVDYSVKVGLDCDEAPLNALRAIAKFHNSGCSNFKLARFDFLYDRLAGVYDVIVMCNWIHNIPPNHLKNELEEIFKGNLNDGGELIFDVIVNDMYKYNHSVEFLTENLNATISRLGIYEHGRVLVSIKK